MKASRAVLLVTACLLTSLAAASEAAAQLPWPPQTPPGEPRDFAPMIWLARDEPLYPMLPHPFAFDGIDNNGDGRFDVADPVELSVQWYDVRCLPGCSEPGSPKGVDRDKDDKDNERKKEALGQKKPRLPCWTTRGHPWGNTGQSKVRPQARALTRVSLWVKDNEQLKPPPPGPGSYQRVFWLYQYWLYYPYDEGPGAHRDDAEHVSVFVEQTKPEAARTRPEEPPTKPLIKAIVGAGHVSDTVNNVLVAGAPGMEALLPIELGAHLPILVELGKHASAPDRDCNGRFDLGFDANLYPQAVWGSRDVWSGNVGESLKVGGFQPWYSYSRSTERLLVEEGWNESTEREKAYLDTCRGSAPQVNDLLSGFDCEGLRELLSRPGLCAGAEAQLEPPLSEPSCGELRTRVEELLPKLAGCDELRPKVRTLLGPPRDQRYSLFPVTILEELHETVEKGDIDQVRRFLAAYRRDFWHGLPPPDDWPELTEEGLAVMRTNWPSGPHLDRRDVWRHQAYEDPNQLFRSWLFTRLAVGVDTRSEAGIGVLGPTVRLAGLPLPKWLAFLGSTQAFHDSRLEAYLHWDRQRGTFYDTGIDFHSTRNGHVGWLLGLTTKHDYSGTWYRRIGLNAGIEVGLPSLPWWEPLRPFSLMLEAGANFAPGQQASTYPTSTSGSAGAPPNVRGYVALRLTYSPLIIRGVRDKHPLGY